MEFLLSFDLKTSFTINLRHVSTNKILLWTEQMDLDTGQCAMGPVIYLVGLGWIGPVDRPANPVTTLWTWTVCHGPCYIPSRPGIDRP